jgi:hypothetical protein
MKQAHKVGMENLVEATKKCTYRETFFSSYVCDIIRMPMPGESSYFIIILEISGSYPNIENTWKELFEDEN